VSNAPNGDRAKVAGGHVTLVGAGPGDPELLTLAGARALASADVVLYDRLVDARLLDIASPTARLVPVGKCKGGGMSQHDINALLVAEASTGAHVVRLKGGDPFLFGRGAEELEALAQRGIAATVIPGVSSALAAPSAAGIPVTHRRVARSCTIVSGHLVDDDDYDWDALAAVPGTLVVLMAAASGRSVAHRLRAGGRPATEPVAVIHAATTDGQQVARMTLHDLARDGSPFGSPSVIVIGPTADSANGKGRSNGRAS
jgi:uroporphyrin-III C-methyltransferase